MGGLHGHAGPDVDPPAEARDERVVQVGPAYDQRRLGVPGNLGRPDKPTAIGPADAAVVDGRGDGVETAGEAEPLQGAVERSQGVVFVARVLGPTAWW